MTTALIVDDEPLARTHLRRLLEMSLVSVAGEAGSGAQALQMAGDLQPDLVFLDIQMPGMSGVETAAGMERLEPRPLIAFVTAYPDYAVAGFEQGALDFLLKPVTLERLATALVRLRERLAIRAAAVQRADRNAGGGDAGDALQRLPVRKNYGIQLIPVEEIACTVARDKRVYVRSNKSEHCTSYTLKQLESMLPERTFFRLHESAIVNLMHVERVVLLGDHSYAVKLTCGLELPVGRTRYSELRRRLGIGRDAPL
jgi:DNA-binding LytR/AlgR family response regulator